VNNDDHRPLRIGVVGGIFGFPPEYRARVRWTPETVLAEGLRARGHDVVTIGHPERFALRDFDIVHVHHLSWGALRAATDRSGTPFVFTRHGGTSVHPATASFVIPRADGIVALSTSEAATLRRPDADRNVTVIPNGVDPSVFSFRQPDAPKDEPWRILFVGQLSYAKGVDRLLEAVADLRRRHLVELELRYHNSTDEQALRTRSRELQLEDIVRFAGATDQDGLAERYRASHMVVLPSLAEALPSVLTEAMLTGTLPVATDVGGVREQLGAFGVLLPTAGTRHVIAGIETAIATYANHVSNAPRMRRYAASRFSIEGMVSAHEDLYRHLRGASGSPRRLRGKRRWGTTLAGPPFHLWVRLKKPQEQVHKGT
jgi:glycosyltransferase involved in cell wall biosynthesis